MNERTDRLGQQGGRAYAVDLRGHGDSDWPTESAYEDADIGRDISARALLEMIPHAHMVAGDRNDAFIGAVLDSAAPLLRSGPGSETIVPW